MDLRTFDRIPTITLTHFLRIAIMTMVLFKHQHTTTSAMVLFSGGNRSSNRINIISQRFLKNHEYGFHHADSSSQQQSSRIFTRWLTSSSHASIDDAQNHHPSKSSSPSLSSSSSSSSPPDDQYIKSYRLHGVGVGSRVDISTNTGHTLVTDVPKKMGGQDSAPQPVETMLAAWMGCTQATAMFVGRQLRSIDHPRGITIVRIEFHDIEGFRDERGALQLPIEILPDIPSRLHRITGTIRVVTSSRHPPLSEERLHILKEQTEARCPVANMILLSGCTIDIDWISVTDGVVV